MTLAARFHGEQNAPAAHPRFSQTFAFRQRSRQARVRGIVGRQLHSLPDAALGGPVEPVKNFLGFAGHADLVNHRPRSRS